MKGTLETTHRRESRWLPHGVAAASLWRGSVPRFGIAERVRCRVDDLIGRVAEGRGFEAIEEFYAPELIRRYHSMPPMLGLMTRSRHAAREPGDPPPGIVVHGVGVNGDTSFIEWGLETEQSALARGRIDRVAVAQWRADKIIGECLLPRS
jgi:hypothetical protein